MLSYRSHYQCVVGCVVLILVSIPVTRTQFGFDLPQSPCPEIFEYRYDGFDYYGYGQLNNPPIGENIVIKANLIVQAQLSGNYYGKLQFVGGPEEISRQIYSNLPINFVIIFPTQDPLPLILRISVNDRVICENNELPFFYGETTKVALQHTFRPAGLVPIPSLKPFETFSEDVDSLEALFYKSTISPIQQTTTTTTSPATNFDGCGKIPESFTALAFGGSTISKGGWPWLAAIHYYKGTSLTFQCAGTIISSSAILSAAHCFYSKESRIIPEDIIIFLGPHNLKKLNEEGSLIANVGSVIIHPDYMTQGKLYSDIAIAKFTKAVEFTELIQPACLWSGSEDLSEVVDQVGVLVGWGKDEYGNLFTPEPKKVQLPIVSNERCLRSNEAFIKITNDRTFCGGWRNGTEGPCQGDSGTGLMLKQDGIWYIRGVVSASVTDPQTGSCNLYEYVVFTDVAKFSSWIKSNIT